LLRKKVPNLEYLIMIMMELYTTFHVNFAHHTFTSVTFPSSRKQLAVHNNMISTTGFCCLLSIFVLGLETLGAPHEHQIKYKNGVMNINNYILFQRSRQRSIFWNTSRHALHTATRVIYLPIFSDLITVMYRYEEEGGKNKKKKWYGKVIQFLA
jgi:hypothetical protein